VRNIACRRVQFAVIAALVGATTVARADALRWTLTLETGPEYDTNPHRFLVAEEETEVVEGAPLTKAGARLRMSWRRDQNERLRLLGFAGGKFFLDRRLQGENVAIVDADARYEWGLRSRSAIVGLRGDYHDELGYDLFDTADPNLGVRAFAGANGEGSVTLMGPDLHRLSAHAGYRDFRYKSNPKYDWRGDHYGLLYQSTNWLGNPDEDLDAASVDVNAWYRLSRRNFDVLAQRNTCGEAAQTTIRCDEQGFDLTPVTGLVRGDLHHRAGGEAVYTGDRIWSARYEAQLTDSNSFGRSVLRHRFEVGVTTEAWAGIFVTGRAVVQLSSCMDPICLGLEVQEVEPTDPLASIEDENRNSLSVHVARDLGDDWSLEGRYVRFSSEFATEEIRYERQTVYAGVVYRYGD